MKEIIALSATHYSRPNEANYGDCFLINTGDQLFIYDCGSKEHAKQTIKYMQDNHFEKAEFILSHNDDDHFLGLHLLLKEDKISKIYTVLLLKHVNDILEQIDDGRRTRDSVSKEILDRYDNIATLSGHNLNDIYDSSNKLNPMIHNEISIIGPSYDYMISTVAKRLDGREGDTVDGETAVNATSVQLSITFDNNHILLTGDSSFAAIEDNIIKHNVIQLPHHGKPKQAEAIFKKKWNKLDDIFIVSDNTGGSNGGSDKLKTSGHKVFNTKSKQITIDSDFFIKNKTIRTASLGV